MSGISEAVTNAIADPVFQASFGLIGRTNSILLNITSGHCRYLSFAEANSLFGSLADNAKLAITTNLKSDMGDKIETTVIAMGTALLLG